MKKSIINRFTVILTFIIIMICSCQENQENSNPSGEGIDQKWDDRDANRSNDSIKDLNNSNTTIKLRT